MYPNKVSSFTSHLSRSSKIRILFPFISEFSSFNNKMESKSQVTLPSSFPSPSMSYFKAIFEAAFNIFLASFIPLLYSHGDISLLICSVICWVVVKPYKDTYMGRHFNLSAKESVLPKAVRNRVAVEAASTFGWHKYVGLDGEVIGLDHFGASAPAGTLFKEFGFTVENVVETALKVVGK